MSAEIADISLGQLLAGYAFFTILAALIYSYRMRREGELLFAALRMSLQLLLVGYLLLYIFENPGPLFSIGVVLAMETFAVRNIYRRVKVPISDRLKKDIAVSMGVGNLLTILFFLFAVIGISPWYDPRYFVTISGMIIGNSMIGISLGVFKLTEGLKSRKREIEAALMFGASPERAASESVRGSFDAAILPVINSMVGMGIVFLPGMMTGQILAGASPLLSIRYQIAIMLAISGFVVLTLLIFIRISFRSFFNRAAQPRF